VELRDDLEGCDETQPDFYGERSTTVARARLCGQCQNYTIKNRLLTCIRCTLDIRPTVKQDLATKKWVAHCDKFVNIKGPVEKSL
jgi:hypothetical protein